MPDRAVVAISEDRQWLVVLDPEPIERDGKRAMWWSVIRWDDIWWQDYGFEEDTGQSADDVLREFLEGRK